MIYFELVEKSVSNRGNIVPVTEVDTEPRDHPAFISMFGYGDEINNWIKLNDSVKGYNGKLHLRVLYFDIDRKNLEKARQDTLALLRHLYNNYGISPDELPIFFSGGKGFHVGIPDRLVGGFDPSSKLPSEIEIFADYITPNNIQGLDLSIYNVNRIFRLPNSKHSDSGLFKVMVSVDELKEGMDKIKEIAEYPRPEFEQKIGYSDLVLNDKLEADWERSRHTASEPKSTEPTDTLRGGDFFTPPEEGERNNKLFKQAAMLFDKGLTTKNVYNIVQSINQASDNPITEDNEDMKGEISTIVRSARKKTQSNKKQTQTAGNKLVSDLIPTYLDYLSPTRRKIGLLFDKFSDDMKWKMRGKLLAVAGDEGTKKSLYCQNVAYQNIQRFDARVVVSNMEMGENALMSRLVDRAFSKYKLRPSDDMEQAMLEGKKGWVKQRLHLLAKHYNDKLIIDSQSAMQPKDYIDLLEETESEYGKVDLLVVDGFSMMGGNSSDRFQRQETNSRELKEIAKDKDVGILAIFHTNGKCEPYYRKAHDYIRGSNKQKDNVDAFISMSLLVDKGKSNNSQDLTYRQDKGYSLMYNKRGSGNVIRSIYNFNPSQLKMTESGEDPYKYEVNVNKL